MTLPSGAHVEIGGIGYRLDEGYEQALGRRCYSHGGRSIFAEQFNVYGVPGARNLKQEDLLWHITNFDGEGQVVMDNADEGSFGRFYRSEGLDFRIPGQGTLNRSLVTQTLPVEASVTATTYAGNAGMTDVSGTSTTSGTDRRLNAVTDTVGTSANYTPGASQVSVDFYLYRSVFTDQDTAIEGDNLKLKQGDGSTSGTNFRLKQGVARTATKTSTASEHFTAEVVQRVEIDVSVATSGTGFALRKDFALKVVDVSRDEPLIVSTSRMTLAAGGSDTLSTTFSPAASSDYQFYITTQEDKGLTLVIDVLRFGPEEVRNTADIIVYNGSGSVELTSKNVEVTATAAGSITGSISFTAAAATNYRFRVERTTGPQYVWVDQIVATLQSGTTWVADCGEVGLGGKVWVGGHTAAGNTTVWRYDPTDDRFEDASGNEDLFATLNDGTSTTAYVVRAMDHSDSLEYFLLSGDEVYTVNASGTDDLYANFSEAGRDLVGMSVCQERLAIMAEDSSGVVIYSAPLDGASTAYDLALDTTNVPRLEITAGAKSPDTNLRQRMCSSPTGVRFFINYGDATAKVYEADLSVSPITYRELADLGHGVKVHAICSEAGNTWIAGQYTAESDQTPKSVLWYIDPNGIVERDTFFRFDSPDSDPPISLVPYQTDIWVLQGEHVWRRSLTRGGLFHEYELQPTTSSEARALAVSAGRVWAVYEDEVWIAGTESTYRQSTVSGGNSHTSSVNDLGLPGVTKSLLSIKVLTKDMPTGTQLILEYQLDGSGTWVTAGTHTSGSSSSFLIATESDPITYNTLQVRHTLVSTNGTATPTWYGTVVTSRASEQEEYWDLVLLTEDVDSSHLPLGEEGKSLLGAGNPRVQHLINLWRNAAPVTLRDGYASKVNGDVSEHIVTVGDFRDERTAVGEGRVVVTLKAVK